jgi:hypothetical protein
VNITECVLKDGAANSLLIDCSAAGIDWIAHITAWGTVGSALIALVVSIVTWRKGQIESVHRREEREAVRLADMRAQAERVSCWLKVQVNFAPNMIYVHNASDQAIWDVQIHHDQFKTGDTDSFAVIAAGSTEEIGIYRSEKRRTADQAVTITFRDNAGRTWKRPESTPGLLILEKDTTFPNDLSTPHE